MAFRRYIILQYSIIVINSVSASTTALFIYNFTNHNSFCFLVIALNRLVKKLDKRLPKRDGDGQFKFKKRVLADPSHLEPPPDSPPWAVQDTASADQEAGASLNTSNCSTLDLSVSACTSDPDI